MPLEGTRPFEVLIKVIALMRETDSVDLSMRQIATSVGTSHRMLGYYFGSREELLGFVMQRLSHEYISQFTDRRPTSRVETIQGAWTMFRDPNNRLQTRVLFALSRAAAERPDIQIPALTSDLDNFARALAAFGTAEGLPVERAEREARLIVSTLLGLYLDHFISQGSDRVDESFTALIDWVTRSSAEFSAG
ncbi:MAG: TetR/AcrR family transcriptional regulator [Rhodoglobus sp.]